MLAESVSLTELAEYGADAVERLRDRSHPPSAPLEWLGLAVGRLPELATRARTVDQIAWRALETAPHLHMPLIEALEHEVASAAALVNAALEEHLRRHPDSIDGVEPELDADGYADLLAHAHKAAPRRAEFLMGGYAAFLAGAIETAGALADAEIQEFRRELQPREEVELRGAQVYQALVNALGGLLAYARLSGRRPPVRTAG